MMMIDVIRTCNPVILNLSPYVKLSLSCLFVLLIPQIPIIQISEPLVNIYTFQGSNCQNRIFQTLKNSFFKHLCIFAASILFKNIFSINLF